MSNFKIHYKESPGSIKTICGLDIWDRTPSGIPWPRQFVYEIGTKILHGEEHFCKVCFKKEKERY